MIKQRLFLIIYFILFANYGLAVCIDEKGMIDLACKCQTKNACMKFYTKELSVEAKQVAKNIGEDKAKKLYSINVPQLKMVDKMFAGKIDPNKLDFKKYETANKKLDNLNKNLARAVEKTLKKKKVKNYKVGDIKSKVNEIFEKNIPKSVLKKVSHDGVSLKRVSSSLSGKSSGGVLASTSGNSSFGDNRSEEEQNANLSEEELIAKKEAEEGRKLTKDEKQRILSAREAAKVLDKKKFKTNDIHPKHVPLWQVISKRYAMVASRLDQKGIQSKRHEGDKKKALADIFELVDLL